MSKLSGEMNKKLFVRPVSSIKIFSPSPFSSSSSGGQSCTSKSPSSPNSLDAYGCYTSSSSLTAFDISSCDRMSHYCNGDCQVFPSTPILAQYEVTNQMEDCNLFYPIGTYCELESCSIIEGDEVADIESIGGQIELEEDEEDEDEEEKENSLSEFYSSTIITKRLGKGI